MMPTTRTTTVSGATIRVTDAGENAAIAASGPGAIASSSAAQVADIGAEPSREARTIICPASASISAVRSHGQLAGAGTAAAEVDDMAEAAVPSDRPSSRDKTVAEPVR